MNGFGDRWIIALAGSVIVFLLGLVIALIGWAVRTHVDHDSQRDKETWDELQRHRTRLHDIHEDISKWKIETLKDRQ